MDKRYSPAGYSLVELLVVIAIMTFIAALTAYGLRNQNRSQVVISAQRDFLNNLRSEQNKVTTGAGGQAVRQIGLTNGSSTYTVSGQTITLPLGVTYTITGGGTKTVCFANQNLSSYSLSVSCGGCNTGMGFICSGFTLTSPTTFDVTFSNGLSPDKTVHIEGSGTAIGRVYVTN